ncbi:MAG TPA: NAD(P)H-quinone oxidoreductase [Rhodothermales bacterium]|nr:NAD(P)H-quinone oxidoreductase [Rhodothermales bacterium]
MKAVLVREAGGPENLYIGDAPRPEPAEDELLVRVQATALNRADLLQRQGAYPPPKGASDILGLELAGTVAEVGTGCDGWAVGDRVFGLLPGGGYAEYAVLPGRMAMPIPAILSFEEAAAIPEVFLTAFQALFWLGQLQEGQHVLIHAGASGVGTAAIQLARAVGAVPFVTASAPKHNACLALGAEAAIDYQSEDFAARITDLTDGRGVEVILDFIGASYFEANVQSLARDGRLVILAMMGGRTVESVDLRSLFSKRAHLLFTTLRSRSPSYKIDLTQDFASRMLPLFEEGRLKSVIDTVMDWQDVQDAHRRMGANKNIGKIILQVNGAPGSKGEFA